MSHEIHWIWVNHRSVCGTVVLTSKWYGTARRRFFCSVWLDTVLYAEQTAYLLITRVFRRIKRVFTWFDLNIQIYNYIIYWSFMIATGHTSTEMLLARGESMENSWQYVRILLVAGDDPYVPWQDVGMLLVVGGDPHMLWQQVECYWFVCRDPHMPWQWWNAIDLSAVARICHDQMMWQGEVTVISIDE